MTSLEFFRPVEPSTEAAPQWGTGGPGKAKMDTRLQRPPSWHYSGKPQKQDYNLTPFKLSNLRINDQLLTKPQEFNIQTIAIPNTAPAEHPYTSHMSRFAVFPSFEYGSDPMRGVDARKDSPLNAEVPANQNDVIILSKIKGHPFRRELQKLPSESRKTALHWKSNSFDQIPKLASNPKQQFYPTPIQQFSVNHENRLDSRCIRGDMTVSKRTGDAAKNVERAQWISSYDMDHTGLGTTNPLNLDNWSEKLIDPYRGNGLEPRSVKTYDPARPVEGRIARALTAPPAPQTDKFPNPPYDTNYRRKLTRTEVEELRLLGGTIYSNLPYEDEVEQSDREWKQMQDESNPQPHLDHLTANHKCPEMAPYQPAGTPTDTAPGHLEVRAGEQERARQQMEAANRWSLLESITPAHDITALHHKTALCNTKSLPHVFYDHEGKYQRERAGLYKTSYDPAKLEHAMNHKEEAGARRMDTSESHRDALDVPVALNQDMASCLANSRTLGGPPGSVPQLNDQPSLNETFGPFEEAKLKQRKALQPGLENADVRTQEGELIGTDTLKGYDYDTKKFLQDSALPSNVRQEPLHLMSKENQNLERVRMISTESEGVPPIRHPKEPYERQLPEVLPLDWAQDNQTMTPKYSCQLPTRSTSQQPDQILAQSVPNDLLAPSIYKKKLPSYLIDTSYKNDDRFRWKPGCGTPRPQSCLLELQNSFSKTEAKRKFRQQFPENLPDLRENILKGRRHEFGGFNAQVFRGTPIVEVA